MATKRKKAKKYGYYVRIRKNPASGVAGRGSLLAENRYGSKTAAMKKARSDANKVPRGCKLYVETVEILRGTPTRAGTTTNPKRRRTTKRRRNSQELTPAQVNLILREQAAMVPAPPLHHPVSPSQVPMRYPTAAQMARAVALAPYGASRGALMFAGMGARKGLSLAGQTARRSLAIQRAALGAAGRGIARGARFHGRVVTAPFRAISAFHKGQMRTSRFDRLVPGTLVPLAGGIMAGRRKIVGAGMGKLEAFLEFHAQHPTLHVTGATAKALATILKARRFTEKKARRVATMMVRIYKAERMAGSSVKKAAAAAKRTAAGELKKGKVYKRNPKRKTTRRRRY